MHVLHLITSTRSFFEEQIRVLEGRGVTCTVLDAPGEYRADQPRSPMDYLRYYPQVIEAIRRLDVDIVHAHYGLVAPFALAQPIRPVVLSLWGTDLMSEMRWLRWLSHVGARFSDATILPSPVMQEALDTDHEVIPFGIDLDRFQPLARDEARHRIGWETDGPIALFPYDPARAEKNHSLAIQVTREANVDVELRTIIDVPYEQIPMYLNASDVLLITSNREAGPMTVKEAAACNVPIVSTDVGFVRGTIENVENCVVATDKTDLIRGLEKVLTDGRRSDGRAKLTDLGLDSMGDRLCQLYSSLLNSPDPGGDVTLPGVGTTHGT